MNHALTNSVAILTLFAFFCTGVGLLWKISKTWTENTIQIEKNTKQIKQLTVMIAKVDKRIRDHEEWHINRSRD